MKFSRLVEANSMKTQEAAVPLMNHEKRQQLPRGALLSLPAIELLRSLLRFFTNNWSRIKLETRLLSNPRTPFEMTKRKLLSTLKATLSRAVLLRTLAPPSKTRQ
jgi:hypothetical protein